MQLLAVKIIYVCIEIILHASNYCLIAFDNIVRSETRIYNSDARLFDIHVHERRGNKLICMNNQTSMKIACVNFLLLVLFA